jgi:hypothetical protein
MSITSLEPATLVEGMGRETWRMSFVSNNVSMLRTGQHR